MTPDVPHSWYESAEWRAEERSGSPAPEGRKLSPFAQALKDALLGEQDDMKYRKDSQVDTVFRKPSVDNDTGNL
jgi:hypothetical protein